MVYVKIRTLGLGIVFSKLASLRVHIFVFLSLVWQLCGVRETVKTWRGSWRELDKNGREGKGRKCPALPSSLPQLSTGQASNHNQRWRYGKPDLSSVPFLLPQNLVSSLVYLRKT